LLAAGLFDRFDPARESLSPKQGRQRHAIAASEAVESLTLQARVLQLTTSDLTPLVYERGRSRFVALVLAELRLLLWGGAWRWYIRLRRAFSPPACLLHWPMRVPVLSLLRGSGQRCYGRSSERATAVLDAGSDLLGASRPSATGPGLMDGRRAACCYHWRRPRCTPDVRTKPGRAVRLGCAHCLFQSPRLMLGVCTEAPKHSRRFIPFGGTSGRCIARLKPRGKGPE